MTDLETLLASLLAKKIAAVATLDKAIDADADDAEVDLAMSLLSSATDAYHETLMMATRR